MSIQYSSLAALLGVMGTISGVEIRASCPLHQDRNPSFSLNTENGLWICHSRCGSGNFQQLVEKKLNYTWQEAREWIDTNGQKSSLEDMMLTFEKAFASPSVVNTVSASVLWKDYFNSLSNQQMPQWFMDRGFSWEVINHFGIRYDIFTDAIVVPVVWQGLMVGIIIRNTRLNLPKYQNSIQLPRERIFYGEINRDQTTIILCEGVLDAIWLWQHGYHGVSLLGASLTAGQIGVLRDYRYGSIVLALDNDEAGINGTKRAINALVSAGWLLPQIKRIRFPGNYRNKGPEYRKDAQDCSAEELALLYEQREDVIGI